MPSDSTVTSIDPYRLDYEFARQSELYRAWAEPLATAEADLDDAQTELDLVKAEVANAIRREPDRYALNKSKISETMIKAILPLQPEYQDAIKEVNRIKRLVGSLKAMVKAIDQKKTSLENLVKLQLGGFYAEPKIPRGMKEQIQVREDKKLRVPIDRKKRAK